MPERNWRKAKNSGNIFCEKLKRRRTDVENKLILRKTHVKKGKYVSARQEGSVVACPRSTLKCRQTSWRQSQYMQNELFLWKINFCKAVADGSAVVSPRCTLKRRRTSWHQSQHMQNELFPRQLHFREVHLQMKKKIHYLFRLLTDLHVDQFIDLKKNRSIL